MMLHKVIVHVQKVTSAHDQENTPDLQTGKKKQANESQKYVTGGNVGLMPT
jgi:hypothetical protein